MSITTHCTWGDGEDVMIIVDGSMFVPYEEPWQLDPPYPQFEHGIITKGSIGLRIDKAEELLRDLTISVAKAKQLDQEWIKSSK